MTTSRMTLSRRALIHLVGRAGGVAAAYRTMAAMGLLPIPAAYAGPPGLPPGNGRRVLIIGAGIAGMVVAYELNRAGYMPTILEARARPGGRNWSLRAGDEVVRGAPAGTSVQHVPGTSASTCISTPARRGCRITTRASCRTAGR